MHKVDIDRVNMTASSSPSPLREGQIIIPCRKCGAPMAGGVIQRGGAVRFVCTRNLEYILFIQQNN